MISVAIIGRPNVGKSSLFNVLSKSRKALVADIPGLTRDRHYSKLYIKDKAIWLIDTGGFEPKNKDAIAYKMSEQTKIAIDESDCIFFVVDARIGCHPIDEQIASFLRKKNKKIFLLINKSEGMSAEIIFSDFSRLGFNDYLCISASHNEGIQLLKELMATLDDSNLDDAIQNESHISLAILGKPNVGKSTLANSFIGEDRFIAMDQPGTTRDSISTTFTYKEKNFLITDTAGIRKKGRVTDVIEKFSILKAIKAIDASNVCILVVDATEGIGQQDLQILGYIIDAQKPLVIGLNKWDKLSSYKKDQLKINLDKRLAFLTNIEKINISALNKLGLNTLLSSAIKAYIASCTKFKTPVLNKFLEDIQINHLPPINKGIRPKLKFAHQGGSNPPTIIIHGNHLSGIKKDYVKFLETSFIKTFELIGTPLIINFKEGKNPYVENDKKPIKTGLVTKRRIINKARERFKSKARIKSPKL